MIDVYVWMEHEGAWGHAAMYVENEASGERRYISFWPRVIACAGDEPLAGCEPAFNSYASDCSLEGGVPHHDFVMNFGARDDVSEAGILAGWARIKREQPLYAALRNNCCTVVASLLLQDGGARGLTRYPDRLLWTPDDLYGLMRSFPFSVPCGERITYVPVPPDVGP